MSLKRSAATDLNHDNWDNEEKIEEKGSFSEAPPEELQNRVIKKARRKLTGEGQIGSDTNKTVFSNFKGFGTSVASASTVSSPGTFSFLSKLTSSNTAETENASKNNSDTPKDFRFNHSTTYYGKLKALNQSVSNWIKDHVDKNPLCILTPIFKDYEKYLEEIKEKSENENHAAKFDNKDNSFQIGSNLKQITNNVQNNSSSTGSSLNLFKFPPTSSENEKTTSAPVTNTDGLGSGTGNNKNLFGSFSARNNKPFSFGAQVCKQADTSNDNESKNDNEEENDEEEPPKVEFTPVVEEDSVFSKKCKVFIKNDDKYTDLGVGTLHLKSVKDSDKTQLLCRANTNIGKILLNLILNEGIPTQRMGKNNVMMVCIPTPESNQKPVTVLLRVKTVEEADELLEAINKYKK